MHCYSIWSLVLELPQCSCCCLCLLLPAGSGCVPGSAGASAWLWWHRQHQPSMIMTWSSLAVVWVGMELPCTLWSRCAHAAHAFAATKQNLRTEPHVQKLCAKLTPCTGW